jgi:hypothetical protein
MEKDPAADLKGLQWKRNKQTLDHQLASSHETEDSFNLGQKKITRQRHLPPT